MHIMKSSLQCQKQIRIFNLKGREILKKKNKYEDIEMIDLDDKVDDIISIYINRLYHTDKTVGVIVNKEIAEYILDNLIRLDETSIKEIDLVDYMNINEYLVSVDDGGVITVVPIEDFCVLDKTDIFYIDMDGDIEQDVIDYCVNEDKEVILFGETDDKDCECCDYTNCKHTSSTTNYFINDKPVSKEEYEDAMAEIDARYQDFCDEFDELMRDHFGKF